MSSPAGNTKSIKQFNEPESPEVGHPTKVDTEPPTSVSCITHEPPAEEASNQAINKDVAVDIKTESDEVKQERPSVKNEEQPNGKSTESKCDDADDSVKPYVAKDIAKDIAKDDDDDNNEETQMILVELDEVLCTEEAMQMPVKHVLYPG